MPKLTDSFSIWRNAFAHAPDLAAVTNRALELEGFPPHTEEQIRTFVGNGALALARLAVPMGLPKSRSKRCFAILRACMANSV